MHFNTNPSVIVRLNLIRGLKYNVNILGEGEIACCDSPSGLCAVLEWTILLYYAGPEYKLHFKGSILLLLKSVSVVQANTFCIDLSPPSLPKTFIAIPSSEARI